MNPETEANKIKRAAYARSCKNLRFLLPRKEYSERYGIELDQRLLRILALLADWGAVPRELIIRYGCTDKDITFWKNNKYIKPFKYPYKPSRYTDETLITCYKIDIKGSKYLKQYHYIWNGDLLSLYKVACDEMGMKYHFEAPKINKTPPQSNTLEHNIAALTLAIGFQHNANTNFIPRGMEIYGTALINAKINHLLGLPIPDKTKPWQHDAIMAEAITSIDQIIIRLKNYRKNNTEPVLLNQRLKELKNEFNEYLHFINSSEFAFITQRRSEEELQEEYRKVRLDYEQEKAKAIAELTPKPYVFPITVAIEYERTPKKTDELDNFFAKLVMATEHQCICVIGTPTSMMHEKMHNQIDSRLMTNTATYYTKVTEYTEYGRSIVKRAKNITYDRDNVFKNIHILEWGKEDINCVAGFLFRKPPKYS